MKVQCQSLVPQAGPMRRHCPEIAGRQCCNNSYEDTVSALTCTVKFNKIFVPKLHNTSVFCQVYIGRPANPAGLLKDHYRSIMREQLHLLGNMQCMPNRP